MKSLISKYLTNVSALQFFQVFRFGILFLTGVVLVKAGLPTQDLGIYESLLFLGSMLSFFWVSGFIQTMLSLYAEHRENEGQFFFNVALMMFACSALAAFAFYQLVAWLPEYGALREYSGVFIFYILLSGPAFLVEYIYLLRKQASRIVMYGVLTFSAQIMVVTLPVILGYGLIFSVYGLVAVAALRFLCLLFELRNAAFALERTVLKKLGKLASPLVVSSLLSGSAEYIDGFLVTWFYDEEKFAIFRYGAKELPLFLLIANAFSNAMVPEIAQNKDEMDEVLAQIKLTSTRMMHAFFPLAAAFMLMSPMVYPLLFKAEFAESAAVFNVYLLLLVSRMVFPQTILIGRQKTKYLFWASLIEIIVNVGLSILFIQLFGLVGVAFATVIASFLEKGILGIFAWQGLALKPTKYINFKWLVPYAITLLVLYFVINTLY